MVSLEAGLRQDNRDPDPEVLGPIYRQGFMDYIIENPHMNIVNFGLNCAVPEELIASLNGMFNPKKQVQARFLKFHIKTILETHIFLLNCCVAISIMVVNNKHLNF